MNNISCEFIKSDFIAPPSIFWPGYFWLLNDRINEEKLIAQLHDMYSHRARSLCLLPEPPEFRPKKFGTKLDLPYLSEKYFKMIQTIADECEKLGMNYWLYDEGGWPSGGACGQVYKKNPEKFAREMLIAQEYKIAPNTNYRVPDNIICAFSDNNIYRPGNIIENKDCNHEKTIRIFLVEKNMGYPSPGAPVPNLLCQQATETFIELTHEQYKKHIGQHFGKSIKFAFTDEPAVSPTNANQLTWVEDLPEIFKQKKGYDLVEFIPRLLAEPSDDEDLATTRARIDFYDVWSQLFVERYFIPLRNWCRENNLLSGGHIGGEDEPIGNAIHGYGHILRTLRAFDLPGVDAIWRQIFPGVRNPVYPKYASSVARQMNQPYVMSESFGVYGNGLTLWQMKWIVDQQYVRGITLLIPICYPYSTRENLMPGERPHFGPINPLWKYIDIFHTYVARLGYLLTRGRPVCSTAFYYDIRSIWAGASTQKKAIELHEAIAETLLSSQCEFDFIDDDTLASGICQNGFIQIGTMQYDTLIVPATRWMTDNAIESLKRFVHAGGKLIIIDGHITGFDENQSDKRNNIFHISTAELPKLLSPIVKFETPTKNIRVCKRKLENASIYFLVNESDKHITIKANFDEQSTPILCDIESGELYRLENTILEFQPWDSVMIMFELVEHTELSEIKSTNKKFTNPEIRTLDKNWTLQPIREYRVGQNDFEIMTLENSKPMPVELGDWKKYLGEYFSGDAKYKIEFECSEQVCSADVILELGQIKYACEIILNNESIARRVWTPFSVDITGKLKTGINTLEIIVTNTLANALLDPKVEQDWYSRTGPGWPTSGLAYDKLARKFERDSLSSGLFGPVKIIWQI